MDQRLDTEPDGGAPGAPAVMSRRAAVPWIVAVVLMAPIVVAEVVDAFGRTPDWLLVPALACCGVSCAIVAVLGVVAARRRGLNPVVALARGVWTAIRWLFSAAF